MAGESRFDELLDLLAERVVDKLRPQLTGVGSPVIRQRLLKIEEGAKYIGRTVDAMRHMINSGKIRVVRADRRIFLDVRELDDWIERNKESDGTI